MVLSNAGLGIGKTDEEFKQSGAVIVKTREEIFDHAEMIVKVKEPQLEECALLKENQILFTYLHLAPDPDQAKALINSGATAIAYESVKADDGSYPLLTPMSEVAGRMAVQAGASCLEKAKGGKGLLIGGVSGVDAANVVIIGGGVVGINSIEIAIGMQANVTVLDKSATRLDYLVSIFGDRLNAVIANSENNKDYIQAADLVIGAVLIPGASAPKIITRDLVKRYLLPNANDKTQVLLGRVFVVLIVVMALLVAATATDALVLLGGLAVAYGFQMWPALIAICFWPWLTRLGITLGLIAGLIAVTCTESIGAALGITAWGRWPLTIHSAGWGIFFNLGIAILVSFFIPVP